MFDIRRSSCNTQRSILDDHLYVDGGGAETRTKKNKLHFGRLSSCLGAASSSSPPSAAAATSIRPPRTVPSNCRTSKQRQSASDRLDWNADRCVRAVFTARGQIRPADMHHQETEEPDESLRSKRFAAGRQQPSGSASRSESLVTSDVVPDDRTVDGCRHERQRNATDDRDRFDGLVPGFRFDVLSTAADDCSASMAVYSNVDDRPTKRPRLLQRHCTTTGDNDEQLIARCRSTTSTLSIVARTGRVEDMPTAAGVKTMTAICTTRQTKTEVVRRARRTRPINHAVASSLRRTERLESVGWRSTLSTSSSAAFGSCTRPTTSSEMADSGYGGTTVASIGLEHSGDWNDDDFSRWTARDDRKLSNRCRLGRLLEESGQRSVDHNDDRDVGGLGQKLQPTKTDILSAGHVRISVGAKDERTFSVSVIEARNLKIPNEHMAPAFMQICVLTTKDHEQDTRSQSTEIHENGLFCKICIDLDLRDADKRLEISYLAQCNSGFVVIGAVSFSISRLLRNIRQMKGSMTGWYHLLPESVGKLKHIRVTQKQLVDDDDKENISEQPSLHHASRSLRQHSTACSISSGQKGYTAIQQARDIGRRTRANRSMTPDDVIDRVATMTGDVITPLSSSKQIAVCNDVAASTGSSRRRKLFDAIFRRRCDATPTACATDVESRTVSQVHLHRGWYYKWDPDISVISAAVDDELERNVELRRTSSSSKTRDGGTADDEVDGSFSTTMEDEESSGKNDGFIESLIDVGHESTPRPTSSRRSSEEQSDMLSYDIRSPLLCTPNDHSDQNDESDVARARHKLLSVEAEFADSMSVGVRIYSRPLRYSAAISPLQHATLFQNVEKLVRLSDYHVNLLSSAEQADVGAIYLAQVVVLCAAYREYMDGLNDALVLLHSLEQHPNFVNFLQNNQVERCVTSEITSLQTFLERPAVHALHLSQCLYDVLQATRCDHTDYWQIRRTAECMLELCSKHIELQDK